MNLDEILQEMFNSTRPAVALPEAKKKIHQLIQERERLARLEEVKLCQGEKAVSKERYLKNRQFQLEFELSKEQN
jgi:hypothetical protein